MEEVGVSLQKGGSSGSAESQKPDPDRAPSCRTSTRRDSLSCRWARPTCWRGVISVRRGSTEVLTATSCLFRCRAGSRVWTRHADCEIEQACIIEQWCRLWGVLKGWRSWVQHQSFTFLTHEVNITIAALIQVMKSTR